MTETGAMLAAIAAKPVGSVIAYGYPSEPDTIAGSPAFVLLNHRGILKFGGGEQRTYTIPAALLADLNPDPVAAAAILNDALDAVVIAFRSGVTLGGTIVQVRIVSWDSDRSYTMGAASYLAIDLTLEAILAIPVAAYTA